MYGFNNTSHVAPILFRGSWGSNYCDFVGHKKPVVCAVSLLHWEEVLAMINFFSLIMTNELLVPIMVQKFNPVLFVDPESKKNKRATLSYCAVGTICRTCRLLFLAKLKRVWMGNPVGSQDCGLSVWSTETTRPKLVTKNLFTQSVLDISWAPSGYTLLCCSTDGTTVFLQFEAKEVRTAVACLQ